MSFNPFHLADTEWLVLKTRPFTMNLRRTKAATWMFIDQWMHWEKNRVVYDFCCISSSTQLLWLVDFYFMLRERSFIMKRKQRAVKTYFLYFILFSLDFSSLTQFNIYNQHQKTHKNKNKFFFNLIKSTYTCLVYARSLKQIH